MLTSWRLATSRISQANPSRRISSNVSDSIASAELDERIAQRAAIRLAAYVITGACLQSEKGKIEAAEIVREAIMYERRKPWEPM